MYSAETPEPKAVLQREVILPPDAVLQPKEFDRDETAAWFWTRSRRKRGRS